MQVRRRALFVLVTLVTVEIAAVALLVRLGATHPFDLGPSLDAWTGAAPEDALAAALRWVALVAAGWLLVHDPGRRRRRRVHPRAPAPDRGACGAPGATARRARAVRRLVDRALVAGMAVGVTVAAPGVAHAQRAREPIAPVVTVVRDGRSDGLASLPADPAVSADPADPADPGGGGRPSTRPRPTTTPRTTPPLPPPDGARARFPARHHPGARRRGRGAR